MTEAVRRVAGRAERKLSNRLERAQRRVASATLTSGEYRTARKLLKGCGFERAFG